MSGFLKVYFLFSTENGEAKLRNQPVFAIGCDDICLGYICCSVFCYPLDRQSCGVEFYQRETDIILVPKSIEYQGPTDLEQYTVEGVFLCDVVLQVGL